MTETVRLLVKLWDASRRHVRDHHRAWVEGTLAGILAIGALSLSGSAGYVQQVASDPVRRAARTIGGDLTDAGLNRLSSGMSPYARQAALTATDQKAAWTPKGVVGWAVYDMAHPPSLVRRNLSFDEARIFNALVQPSALPIPTLKPFVLPARGVVERERAMLCLTQAVYFEAGFETGEGQAAVAQVVLNRLRHPAYPKSVCGVVYQGSQRTTGCQFSFTCDGSLARVPGEDAWKRAQFVAKRALEGYVYKPVGTSTHYHADYVFPYWAVTLVKLRKIGAHIFYRMTGPSGAPAGFSGRYAGGETALSAAILSGGDARTPDAPSAIEPEAPAVAVAAAETVTLTVGGETRTYIVNAPGALLPIIPTPPGATPLPAGTLAVATAPVGNLTTVRRVPTPDEVKRINEAMAKFEAGQKPASGAVDPDQPIQTRARLRVPPLPASAPPG